MDGGRNKGVLDGLAARLVAVGVALACAATLAYIHRDDLFPPEAARAAETDDPFRRCFARRSGDIDRMLEESLIKEARATFFRNGAEAMCRDQARRARGGGARPALPAGIR